MYGRQYSPQLISELVGLIYDCVLDSGLWSSVIDRIRQEFGFSYIVLGAYPLVSGEITLGVSSGIDAAKLGELTAFGEDIVELWGGHDRIGQFPLEEPIVQSEAVLPATLMASRFFNEWAEPQSIVDAIAIGLERNPRMVSTLSFGRHRESGPLGPLEIEGLRLLAPHFRRAIAISQLLELRSIMAANVATVLESLPTGILIVDELMSLLHANPAGEAMLVRRDTVQIRGGRVIVESNASAIEDAVAYSNQNEAALGRRGGAGFAARGPSGEARMVHVLPLKGREARPGLFRRATAALFVTRADDEIELPSAAFAALYGLTPAEVRITELVVAGLSQAEISQRLGLRSSTVKTHLLRVFNKTGVRRQLDLVRMAASLAGPAHARPSTPMGGSHPPVVWRSKS